jgi:hypothetical protein
MASNPPGFLQALAEATKSAAPEGLRYAVDHIQLRGPSGQMIATDGRQLLVQSGFQFPWTDDVLIPCTGAFACRELPGDLPVSMGKTDTRVTMQVGAWTLHLPLDKERRFPAYEKVIPSVTSNVTHWQLDPADAAFLEKALPRLPGGEEDDTPVTVDLNGQAMIRARAPGQSQITELLLARSGVSGKSVRLNTNRNFLARALHLGFSAISVVNADTPPVCKDERRTFVWMPLDKKGALAPNDAAVRIVAGEEPTSHSPPPERKKTEMTVPQNNGNGHSETPAPAPSQAPENGSGGISALIAEAEALKTLLRDAFGRSNQLVMAIKRHKKQAHVVQATLASLRQLQHIDD